MIPMIETALAQIETALEFCRRGELTHAGLALEQARATLLAMQPQRLDEPGEPPVND